MALMVLYNHVTDWWQAKGIKVFGIRESENQGKTPFYPDICCLSRLNSIRAGFKDEGSSMSMIFAALK
jgi:hypothetical protein